LNIRPDDFYAMSLREFFAALAAKAPPEDRETIFESDDPFFTQEELEKLEEMKTYH